MEEIALSIFSPIFIGILFLLIVLIASSLISAFFVELFGRMAQ